MWTFLFNFFCDKFFSKHDVHHHVRETDSSNRFYGKRIKLSEPESVSKNIVTHQKLPMQAKENVGKVKIDDDDGCCVIAEVLKRKPLGSTFNGQTEVDLTENVKCKENVGKISHEKDKDIKYITHIYNKNSLLNSEQIQKKRFFRSQRSSLTQSKTMKSKLSYRNHFRKKMNLLQECYRLTEKLQYIQLLQSQASCLVAKKQDKITNFSSPSTIPLIDLTNDQNDVNSNKTVINVTPTESGDEEIQIIGEIQGVKSFEEALKIGSNNKRLVVNKKTLVPYQKTVMSNLPTCSRKLRDERIMELLDSKTSLPDSLEERLHNLMQINDGSIEEEENKYEKRLLPKLTPEQEKLVHEALRNEPPDEILTEGFGLSITRKDMHTLQKLNWLNDEVINFYLNLIMDRSKNTNTLPKVYTFNTFFYPKLVSTGYQSLKRWTKNVDIFSYDLILVPIHLGMHWCLSVIDFRSKFIKYFDSVGSPNDSCLEYLFRYLKYEYLDKKKKLFETEGWVLANVEDTPQQMNGSDCGVFSCMFAEYQARDAEISFTQDEMPYFRKKIVIELLEKKLLT